MAYGKVTPHLLTGAANQPTLDEREQQRQFQFFFTKDRIALEAGGFVYHLQLQCCPLELVKWESVEEKIFIEDGIPAVLDDGAALLLHLPGSQVQDDTTVDGLVVQGLVVKVFGSDDTDAKAGIGAVILSGQPDGTPSVEADGVLLVDPVLIMEQAQGKDTL